jgi:cytochrome b
MHQRHEIIWDWPLRVFHWLLALSVPVAYVTGYLGGLWLEWHTLAGQFVCGLVLFRILWGFVSTGLPGAKHSRFSSFLPTLKLLFLRNSPPPALGRHMTGHTPLGVLSIFLLLGTLLLQTITGLYSNNDEIDIHGPLYPYVSSDISTSMSYWHTQLINFLLVLIGLHVFTIAYYALVKKQNRVLPMITGKTTIDHSHRREP